MAKLASLRAANSANSSNRATIFQPAVNGQPKIDGWTPVSASNEVRASSDGNVIGWRNQYNSVDNETRRDTAPSVVPPSVAVNVSESVIGGRTYTDVVGSHGLNQSSNNQLVNNQSDISSTSQTDKINSANVQVPVKNRENQDNTLDDILDAINK